MSAFGQIILKLDIKLIGQLMTEAVNVIHILTRNL